MVTFTRALLMMLGLLLCMRLALGHGPEYTPEEAAWMERQNSIDGMKCCAPYDFHVIQDPQWRMRDGRYEIHHEGAWHQVPQGRLMRHISDDPSPFPGVALLFRTNGANPLIYCFYPPPLM